MGCTHSKERSRSRARKTLQKELVSQRRSLCSTTDSIHAFAYDDTGSLAVPLPPQVSAHPHFATYPSDDLTNVSISSPVQSNLSADAAESVKDDFGYAPPTPLDDFRTCRDNETYYDMMSFGTMGSTRDWMRRMEEQKMQDAMNSAAKNIASGFSETQTETPRTELERDVSSSTTQSPRPHLERNESIPLRPIPGILPSSSSTCPSPSPSPVATPSLLTGQAIPLTPMTPMTCSASSIQYRSRATPRSKATRSHSIFHPGHLLTGDDSPASCTSREFHIPQVIHGLTDENKALYKEGLHKLSETPDWTVGYESLDNPLKCRALYKMETSKTGWMFVAMVIPAPMHGVLCPMLELETWPKWHPTCTYHGKRGTCDAWTSQSYFTQSMALGAFKSEQNTRTNKWINETQGFMLQSVRSLNEGEEGYEPRGKLNREDIQVTMLTLASGPEETMILQLIRVEMPISIPSFMTKFIFGILAPKMLKQLLTNNTLCKNPKHPYKKMLEDDEDGVYKHLKKMSLPDAPRPTAIIERIYEFLLADDDEKKKAKRERKDEKRERKDEKRERKVATKEEKRERAESRKKASRKAKAERNH